MLQHSYHQMRFFPHHLQVAGGEGVKVLQWEVEARVHGAGRGVGAGAYTGHRGRGLTGVQDNPTKLLFVLDYLQQLLQVKRYR